MAFAKKSIFCNSNLLHLFVKIALTSSQSCVLKHFYFKFINRLVSVTTSKCDKKKYPLLTVRSRLQAHIVRDPTKVASVPWRNDLIQFHTKDL